MCPTQLPGTKGGPVLKSSRLSVSQALLRLSSTASAAFPLLLKNSPTDYGRA